MKKITYIILAVMYLVGIIGHNTESLLPLMLQLTPFTLLFTGSLTLFGSGDLKNKQFIQWFSSTYLLTFFAEWLGVKTGLVFGSYNYSEVLGFSIGGVPLIIGFNWVLVVTGSITLASRFHNNTIVRVLLSGFFAVIFDFFLEPMAVSLNYWTWSGDSIPLQNYIAWFIIASGASLLYFKVVKTVPSTIFSYYFGLQLLFFILLQLLQIFL